MREGPRRLITEEAIVWQASINSSGGKGRKPFESLRGTFQFGRWSLADGCDGTDNVGAIPRQRRSSRASISIQLPMQAARRMALHQTALTEVDEAEPTASGI